jgi:hypothetical protein
LTGKNFGASWSTVQVKNYGSSRIKGLAIKDEEGDTIMQDENDQEE